MSPRVICNVGTVDRRRALDTMYRPFTCRWILRSDATHDGLDCCWGPSAAACDFLRTSLKAFCHGLSLQDDRFLFYRAPGAVIVDHTMRRQITGGNVGC